MAFAHVFEYVRSMSTQQDEIRAALDAVDAGYARLRAARSDSVGNAFRVEIAERLETQHRINRGLMYRIFGELVEPPDGPDDPELPAGTVMSKLLWKRLRITTAEVKRRMQIAARICPRRTLTCPELPPELPLLAVAVANGEVGADHVEEVCKGVDALPSALRDKKDVCERILLGHAKEADAKFVGKLANDIAAQLNPDTGFDERDRRRRRGLKLGRQRADGLSYLCGWIDPETRAYVESGTAAVRPGRHRPDPEHGEADEHEEVQPDTRNAAQRMHDAVKLGMRAGISSGVYGQHRGLPVTVIVTTTLSELNRAAHLIDDPTAAMPRPARTGGGSNLPMRDLIRMAANAIHYLAIFDDHSNRPLYLGRTKRIASADQRIICYARDRGCTRPGCTEPGYHCEVNHDPAWGAGGCTDADCLFFDCGPDHSLVTKGLLQTKVTDTGRLAYTDGTGPPEINFAHHPEELLKELFEEDPGGEDGQC